LSRAKFLTAIVAAIAAPLLIAAPASASIDGYGLYASCRFDANDPAYGFIQHGGTAGNGIYSFISLTCSQGESVAMQGRLQQLISGSWVTQVTGPRTPASGYQSLGSGGTAATLNSSVDTLGGPCSNGTWRSWNLVNINGTQHNAYSASVSITSC
jgi:hypothetical protein